MHACMCARYTINMLIFIFYHCPWTPDWNTNSMFQHNHLPGSHIRSHFCFFFLSMPAYNLWGSAAGSEVTFDRHPFSLPSYLTHCPPSCPLLPFLPIQVRTSAGLAQALPVTLLKTPGLLTIITIKDKHPEEAPRSWFHLPPLFPKDTGFFFLLSGRDFFPVVFDITFSVCSHQPPSRVAPALVEIRT